MTVTDCGYRKECIEVTDFPPLIRVTLRDGPRKELFSQAMKKVSTLKREYHTDENLLTALYGERKGKILRMLSEKPHRAKQLIKASGLSPSAVYHFLKFLKKRKILSKKGCLYYVERDFEYLFLNEIVRLEEDPALRRSYGISLKEMELAYFLWNSFVKVTSGEGVSGDQSKYTLADAIHRWKTGRTSIPVWALTNLVELSHSGILRSESIAQYHLPPGTPVYPYYQAEYKLPVLTDGDLDKTVTQLLLKMSRSHMYSFPKRKKWLFEKLHYYFGEFDDSTSRIPSTITTILKFSYGIDKFDRSSACIPPCVKARWLQLNPLARLMEKSGFLLHIISLSSRSNGGYEITSRSRRFLEDISCLTSDLGMGRLNVHKKRKRPHYRVYLSESKVEIFKRYAGLFQEYPDLELWLRIPLNRITEKLISTGLDLPSLETICREELGSFVDSILKSLEKKKDHSLHRMHYPEYKEEITQHFWRQKTIPSPRKVEELMEPRTVEKEALVYA